MNIHKTDQGAVAKAAGEEVPPPAFLRRDQASIDALAARANEAERGGAPLTVSEKLALELAQKEGLITASPEPTARDLIAQGLREAREARITEATAAIDELERIALEVRKARVAPDWYDFKAKRAATARTAELKAEFEKVKGRLVEPLRMIDDEGQFKAEVNAHLGDLESAFSSPFRKP